MVVFLGVLYGFRIRPSYRVSVGIRRLRSPPSKSHGSKGVTCGVAVLRGLIRFPCKILPLKLRMAEQWRDGPDVGAIFLGMGGGRRQAGSGRCDDRTRSGSRPTHMWVTGNQPLLCPLPARPGQRGQRNAVWHRGHPGLWLRLRSSP